MVPYLRFILGGHTVSFPLSPVLFAHKLSPRDGRVWRWRWPRAVPHARSGVRDACAEAATVRAAEIQMAKERTEAQLKEQQEALQREVEAHELQLAKYAPPCGSIATPHRGSVTLAPTPPMTENTAASSSPCVAMARQLCSPIATRADCVMHDRRERNLRAEEERRTLEAAKEQERQLEARLEQQRQGMERQLVEQREEFTRLRAQMEEEARVKQEAAEERARCVASPNPKLRFVCPREVREWHGPRPR